MKTEYRFFDNHAVRIIIAVLTSALGVLLIQGIGELCLEESILWSDTEDTYIKIIEIIAIPLMVFFLIICIRHRIHTFFYFLYYGWSRVRLLNGMSVAISGLTL